MNTKTDFPPETDQRIVYVRGVKTADLPDELRSGLGSREQVFAVHSADGERLALVKDRHLAFVLARQNDMSPVTVH